MPLSSLLPGPHDPYNASSVKLAEATRVRLVLPGLSTPEKEEPTSLNSANSSKLQVEAAAAKEKNRKKLLKIQGIANQADKAHSAVIVDTVVLDSESEPDADEADASSNSAAEQGSEAVAGTAGLAGNRSKRASRQGSATTACQSSSNYIPTSAGAGGAGSGESSAVRSKKPGLRSSGDGAKPSSRLAVPSPRVTSDNEPTSAGSYAASTRTATGTSSKPYVPIWDRQPSTPAEEKRPQATTQRVLQPVAIKTFSPTLGSLGQNINQGEESAPLRSAASGRVRKTMTPAASAADQRRVDCSSPSNRAGSAVASDLQGLRNKSRSFTAGYQNPSQLLERLTHG